MKLVIGSHVSFLKEKQLLGSVLEALSYGANTFMIYTGAPQNTIRMEINNDLTNKAHQLMKSKNINIGHVIVHAPYIINLANLANQDFAISFLKQEIKRVEKLGLSKLIVHPGNHLGQGIKQGLNNIIDTLNSVITPHQKVLICLETMSGKGTECGYRFEQLKTIIDGVVEKDKIAVCFDTCHLNDAGYNINDIEQLLIEFDNLVGLSKLACIHINDSKNEKGSKKDRHANIGLGNIKFQSLIDIIYHPKLKKVPKILETPYISFDQKDFYPPYKFEIEMIKNKTFNDNLLDDIKDYYQKQIS